MDPILEIDPARRTATVQPGVSTATWPGRRRARPLLHPRPGQPGDLLDRRQPRHQRRRHLAAEVRRHRRPCRRGSHAVLADGHRVHTGAATRKNVTGLRPDPAAGRFRGHARRSSSRPPCWLRAATERRRTLVAMFPTVARRRAGGAGDHGADHALRDGADGPHHDRRGQRDDGMGIDADAAAVLLVTCDGPAAAEEAAVCEKAAHEHGATDVFRTDDRDEGKELMNARRMALPALERKGSILLDDVGVPVRAAARHGRRDRGGGAASTASSSAPSGTPPTATCTPRSSTTPPTRRDREARPGRVRRHRAGGGRARRHGQRRARGRRLKLPFVGEMYGEAESR